MGAVASCRLPAKTALRSRWQAPGSRFQKKAALRSSCQPPVAGCQKKQLQAPRKGLPGIEQQRIYIFLTISQFLCRIIKGFNRFAYRLSTLVLKERLAAS